MQIFPSIEPVYAAAKETSPLASKTMLGDGYKKRFSFGLNTIKPIWQIEWMVSAADASSIDLFLKNRGADGEWFYWTPPDENTALKWRCDEWTINYEAASLAKISASFRQVFELEYIDFNAASTICLDDALCGSDVGPGLIRKCWYQRGSDGLERSLVYGSVVDPNGDMYVAQYFGAGILPAIYKISNEVTQVWGKLYSLDPSLVSSASNSYGESYFLLNSSSTTIDFLAWQWSPGGSPFFRDFPIRIYRYRISKANGSIISVAATDFNPSGDPNQLYVTIRDVKRDANNNYYFIGTLPINSDTLTTCVFKFTENLTFVWCKAIPKTVYRGGGVCGVSVHDGNLFASLTVEDSGLIGCAGANTLSHVFPNYFSLNFEGATLASFLPKFSTPNFSSDINPFIPRSVCRDEQGNVYGFGGYNTSVALGAFSTPIVVYKDSPSDTTIWAKDIRNTFYPGRGALVGMGNQLLIVANKLVLVAPWEYLGSYQLLICIFNTTTGAIERSLDFRGPTGARAIIQAIPESGKFIVQTDNGYRIRLDVNDLPPDGSYPFTDVGGAYTITSASTVTTDHTFYRFTTCGDSSPALIDRNLSGMFTPVTPVTTITDATGGYFRRFACQD